MPYYSGHLLWAGDSDAGTVCTVTIRYGDEIGKMGESRGTHTQNRRRPASDCLLVNHITRDSSDLPYNYYLTGAREVNVLVINDSAEVMSAHRWIETEISEDPVTATSNDLQCFSPRGTTSRNLTLS